MYEDKWICKLKTVDPYDLNTKIGDYVKEMCNIYLFSNTNSCQVSILFSHDNEKYDRFRTKLVEFA